MSHLSDVAIVSRKLIAYGGVFLVALMVLRIIWNMGLSWWKAAHPDPPPPPDVKFGKLPRIPFPKRDTQTVKYTLQTKTGQLPALPDQFRVYFMPVKKASLLAFDSARTLANRLNFIQEPTKHSASSYEWANTSPIPSSLKMDVITGSFIYDSRWQNDPSYLTPNQVISEQRAIERGKVFYSRLSLLDPDLQAGQAMVEYLKAENGEMVSAMSLSTSQFLKVHLFRAPVNEVPVVTPTHRTALVTVTLALQKEERKEVVHAEYNFAPVEKERFATYPIIPVATAWQRLQSGQAYTAFIKQGATEVVIRDIKLAYYGSESQQNFLQPVYVFEGDEGFFAYVPAIADEWLQ